MRRKGDHGGIIPEGQLHGLGRSFSRRGLSWRTHRLGHADSRRTHQLGHGEERDQIAAAGHTVARDEAIRLRRIKHAVGPAPGRRLLAGQPAHDLAHLALRTESDSILNRRVRDRRAFTRCQSALEIAKHVPDAARFPRVRTRAGGCDVAGHSCTAIMLPSALRRSSRTIRHPRGPRVAVTIPSRSSMSRISGIRAGEQ